MSKLGSTGSHKVEVIIRLALKMAILFIVNVDQLIDWLIAINVVVVVLDFNGGDEVDVHNYPVISGWVSFVWFEKAGYLQILIRKRLDFLILVTSTNKKINLQVNDDSNMNDNYCPSV